MTLQHDPPITPALTRNRNCLPHTKRSWPRPACLPNVLTSHNICIAFDWQLKPCPSACHGLVCRHDFELLHHATRLRPPSPAWFFAAQGFFVIPGLEPAATSLHKRNLSPFDVLPSQLFIISSTRPFSSSRGDSTFSTAICAKAPHPTWLP